jgi:hypothetical protein
LAKDHNIYVRAQVATNSNTPPEALAQLSKDKNDYIRILIT